MAAIPQVVVDGGTGLLMPFGDAAALIKGLEDFIDHPARRGALGVAARESARANFSADAIVPRYEELYRGVCGA